MGEPADLDRAVAAFTAAVQEHREAAVALDRYRIGAWLRERGRGDIARVVEHGDHVDDDQPAIPSLRMVMAARDEALRRADAADAEVKRLREELDKPIAGPWEFRSDFCDWVRRSADDRDFLARVTASGEWWAAMSTDESDARHGWSATPDACRHDADLVLVAAGFRLSGGSNPYLAEVSRG